MKKTGLLIIGLLGTFALMAQRTVILEHEGVSSAFSGPSPFVEAYDAAVSGDIIYLPGGAIVPPSSIDKGVKIYGVGHYPSATEATSKTFISGRILLQENADGFYLEGAEINGDIIINTNQTVNDAALVRCKFNSLSFNANSNGNSQNWLVRECVVVGSMGFATCAGSLITNSIIVGSVNNGSNLALKNCLFLYEYSSTYGTFENVDNSTIANSIFLKDDATVQRNCDGSTFTNNVYYTTPGAGNSTFLNTYLQTDITTLFENVQTKAFDYAYDYHLTNDAPTLYQTTFLGDKGTEVGIYGGLFPFKAQSVPRTPHISAQTVASSTDNEGLLDVIITVTAQED